MTITRAGREQPAATRSPAVSLTGRKGAQWFAGIPGEHASIRVHSTDVGGRFAILESVAAPGCATPLHSHAEDEVFYVVAGRPTFRLGDDVFEVDPGGVVLIPAGTPHAWINRTQAEQRMIATFAPGGVEDLFTRIAGLSPVQIATLAASYGTIVLGPPMPL